LADEVTLWRQGKASFLWFLPKGRYRSGSRKACSSKGDPKFGKGSRTKSAGAGGRRRSNLSGGCDTMA
jgi:hypothetical protein